MMNLFTTLKEKIYTVMERNYLVIHSKDFHLKVRLTLTIERAEG